MVSGAFVRHQSPSAPIGVFDSGIGGLTVLDAVRAVLPGEDYIYLGDTARVPYGNRASSTIVRYSMECAGWLVERGVKAVVVACNTASAHALGQLRAAFGVPVFGVIEPVSRYAARSSRSKSVAVIGTRATISSHAYRNAMLSIDGGLGIHELACPLFVPLVEEGWAGTSVAFDVVKRYFFDKSESGNISDWNADILILGCTHYPVLRQVIDRVLADGGLADMGICECGGPVGCEMKAELGRLNLLSPKDCGGEAEYFVTDDPGRFMSVAGSFMRTRPSFVGRADIG